MRVRGMLTVLAVLLLTATIPDAAGAVTPANTPTAESVPGIADVGPLFDNGLTNDHGCTASILQSPQHDLILTAGHCVSGTGAGLLFAPGYDDGHTPYGVWTTTAAYVDPSWIGSQDPQHDYAILRLATQVWHGRTVGVQQVTGGGNVIVPAPRAGKKLTVPAYPAGINDRPIDCAVTVYKTDGYPSFDCAGYFGGTSGAPWLIRVGNLSLVAGVIGGLHQGGCVDFTSYSSAFSTDTYRLWLRAALRLPADTVPAAGSDGC
ncbi:MAG: serine protease [Actinomycetota bacterium]|nr:serine protease [Actinomycetota bacterium]MDQ2956842.1 serine protease [Actinomycetota bacterium]